MSVPVVERQTLKRRWAQCGCVRIVFVVTLAGPVEHAPTRSLDWTLCPPKTFLRLPNKRAASRLIASVSVCYLRDPWSLPGRRRDRSVCKHHHGRSLSAARGGRRLEQGVKSTRGRRQPANKHVRHLVWIGRRRTREDNPIYPLPPAYLEATGRFSVMASSFNW